MTFAAWCILAAAFLPYASVGLAKFGGRGYDNAAPRVMLAGLTGWRARAEWAHRNHFEAFGPFAVGVLVAQGAHAPQGMVDVLAGAFVLLRLGYTGAYVAGWASVRSLLWLGGVVCVVLLFVSGLR